MLALRFDGYFWDTEADNFLEQITGIILSKAANFHYGATAPALADQAEELFFGRFPDLKSDYENLNGVADGLNMTMWAGLENYCGDYRDTREEIISQHRALPGLLANPKYGPYLKDLMDRCYTTGQELAWQFVAKYGAYYRTAVLANPYAPTYAFAHATLEAGLPLEKWLITKSDLNDELRLTEDNSF